MWSAVIVNPVSGRGGSRPDAAARRRALAESIASVLGGAGGVEVVLTEGPGHAARLARTFVDRGADVVVAWGGDGTINEVAGPLIGTGTALGIVPAGSGNGLAHVLGIPDDPAAALEAAIAPRSRTLRMDVGYLGGRHFLNIGGIGFDATVAAAFDRQPVRGALTYFLLGSRLVWGYRSPDYVVEFADRRLAGPKFIVAFANGREYGNGAVLAPDADPADGLLDLAVVDGGSALEHIWRARRLVLNQRKPAAGVLRARVTAARVSGDRLLCHVDGEVFEAAGSVDVRVAPGALRVVQPAAG